MLLNSSTLKINVRIPTPPHGLHGAEAADEGKTTEPGRAPAQRTALQVME